MATTLILCSLPAGVFLLREQRVIVRPRVTKPSLSSEVRTTFGKRCAGCHGADLPNPKGRFGYVLDLKRIAGNPEMVIPFHPEQSEFWIVIERNEMPPADSPQGNLTSEEKETIRSWIASGANDSFSDISDSHFGSN